MSQATTKCGKENIYILKDTVLVGIQKEVYVENYESTFSDQDSD